MNQKELIDVVNGSLDNPINQIISQKIIGIDEIGEDDEDESALKRF